MTLTEKANNESVFTWVKDQTTGHEYLSVEHAVLIFKNFSGAPTKFVPQGGKRTFNVVLSDEAASELKELGWNVKEKAPRNPDEEFMYTTEIVINMNARRQPHLWLCSEKNGKKRMTMLDENTMSLLDDGEFSNIDIIINPWKHDKSKDFSVKGYLHAIWATQSAGVDFGDKYAEFEIANDPAANAHPTDEDDGDLPF